MNKIFSLMLGGLAVLSLTGCYNDFDDEPAAEWNGYTCDDLPEANTSIGQVKAAYCASNTSAGHSESSSNFWTLIKNDLIFEGVIVANDISGNLYQSLYVRNISDETPINYTYTYDSNDTTRILTASAAYNGSTYRYVYDYQDDGTVRIAQYVGGVSRGYVSELPKYCSEDQTILLGIKSASLAPYFPVGQRIRVNCKGLYAGVYSKTPKIGTPYYTSAGNNRLGPALTQDIKIMKIGTPDPTAPELTPMDLTTESGESWLQNASNQSYVNCPILATVDGKMKENQGAAARAAAAVTEDTWKGVYEAIYKQTTFTGINAETGDSTWTSEYYKLYAPECLRDAGYGIDRTLTVNSKVSVTLRTSSGNNIALLLMPKDSRQYTGILTYYSGWQMTLRHEDDIVPNLDPTFGFSTEKNIKEVGDYYFTVIQQPKDTGE